jgi:tetratricopeptide (TPR) repeat protein
VEEIKRRRLTLALATTVLLAITLAGGGWLWVKNERDARQARVTRDVNDALNKATALREQAKAASTGSAALFAQAREQAQRALALVASGPAHPALAAQVSQLQAELDDEEKDRQLLAALEAAHLAQAETVAGANRFAEERALPLFREAFRAYGLPIGEGQPGAAAGRIRKQPAAVREAIVAALDEWDELAFPAGPGIPERHRGWVRALLEAVEPDDGWSRQLRAARREGAGAKRHAALEALAASAKVHRVPARALTRLAAQLGPAQRLALLRRVQRQYPADFWANHELAIALELVTPPDWQGAVRFLTAAAALRPDSPGVRSNLGNALKGKGKVDEAIACYRQALALNPKYAAAHHNLGNALKDKGRLDEAIACFRRALELDPKSTLAHLNLGNALKDKGQVDEAIACYKRAIELNPKYAAAHNNLGAALHGKGKLDEAIDCYRKAIELDSKHVAPHTNLGDALWAKRQLDEAIARYRRALELDPTDAKVRARLGTVLCDGKGDYDGAIACFRRALELKPDFAAAHSGLGVALSGKGRVDEAIACYRRSLELDPTDAQAHYNLGTALWRKRQLDGAIGCFRRALELEPDFAEVHCNLGLVLLRSGRFAESLAALRRGHALGTKKPGWRCPSAEWVRSAERMATLAGKLPAIRRGEYAPADNAERLALAELCQIRKLHHMASRVYADAFAAEAKLADDPKAYHRHEAARSASLAAAGQADDAANLDEMERTRLRKQALDWLRADLALYRKQLRSDKPADRAVVQRALLRWQKDSDLAGLRDEAALARLPVEEREAFARLWSEVAALLKKAEVPTTKESAK